MATFTNEEREGRIRTTVQLQPGEKVKLCRCWRSATFPFCDGSHKQVPDGHGPLTVQVPQMSTESETLPSGT